MSNLKEPTYEITAEPQPLYQVRMAVKTPSTQVQYRMLEADVTVSGNNPEVLMEQATARLAQSILYLTQSWGEVPPEEIRGTLETLYEEDDVAGFYGEEKD